MSKSKMKKKVAASQQKNAPKKQEQKKKWVKPRDFNFLRPVKFLPGFRSAKHWKRLVAMCYYCVTPVSLFLKFMDFSYFGVFVFVGYDPESSLFAGQLELSENGYILADERLHTNIPGVFVAGDVRAKELRQIITASADGATAAVEAEKYLK